MKLGNSVLLRNHGSDTIGKNAVSSSRKKFDFVESSDLLTISNRGNEGSSKDAQRDDSGGHALCIRSRSGTVTVLAGTGLTNGLPDTRGPVVCFRHRSAHVSLKPAPTS